MLRVLPVLVAIVLLVYCLVDLAQSSSAQVRTMPRWAWAVLLLLVPIFGPIAWLAAGRPVTDAYRGSRPVPPREVRPVAPDDDPEFLARLKEQRQKAEDDRLRKWQADLERRERELGRSDDDSSGSNSSGS
ncbi:PLD nuclease N-terminal domain-containing protein [Actinopolymorpha alba]|uniref:PLD nuclease N-terminal domain-containing protein n=1 Tax=Actinopolymorpha alba TaxID=533267 RepID=UPI000369F6B1|nr:PLD nuclease N-terminal domain-containing protein [Actinopolymorpha alba]